MISKQSSSECFVYIVLPGEMEFVTAGRFELTTDRHGVATGRFVYGRSYLARNNAVPLDPVELKLRKGTYQTTALKGVFGAIRDASPDYWGRRVIERHAGKAQLGELDYLLFSPHDRAGALGFGLNPVPSAPHRRFNQAIDLDKLIAFADVIIADEGPLEGAEAGQVEELILQGSATMGGARPKAVVENDEGLWVAKFNRPDDRWNSARVEHAMLMLARECGIQSAESKVVTVGNRDVLLVKRFDREKSQRGYLRARMVSGLTLLRAEDTHRDREKWSYVLLVEELRRVSAEPKKDAPELFRRMCFNALISNIDDHPRNHALIAKNLDWKLSPAYDLTPSTPISLEKRDLAMICGDMGRHAQAENLLSQSARFLLKADEAKQLIDEMEQKVTGKWYDMARREGVTEKDCKKIASAFAYSGFRLEITAGTG